MSNDVIQLPFRTFDASDPDSMVLAIQKNFYEIERYLSLLQMYIKSITNGKVSDIVEKASVWDRASIINEDGLIQPEHILAWLAGRRGNQFPINPYDGELFYRTDEDKVYRYSINSEKWIPVDTVADATRISDGIITVTKLADGSVSVEKLQDGAVVESKIANEAVTATKIATGAIDATKFATGVRPVEVVSTLPTLPDNNYPAGAVVFCYNDNKLYYSDGTTWKSNDFEGPITETQIADGAITTPKLAANAVTADKLAANSVIAGKIAAGVITSSEIATGAITAEKIAAGAVGATAIAAGSITSQHIATEGLAADVITSGTIDTSLITITNEDSTTTLNNDGMKIYDSTGNLVGHLGKFDTGQAQTVLTEDTQADFNTGTLIDVVATAAGNLELAKNGTGVSVIETTQADFQAGTLTNVVATSTGNLELQTVSAPSFSRSSVAYTSTSQQVAANVPRFGTGAFGDPEGAVLVEEGTTNALPYPLTQEYVGGILRSAGSYYTTSGFRIIATGQPSNGPLPGCRLNITGGKFTVKGKTDCTYIHMYWTGFNSAGATVIPQTFTYTSVVGGWFETTIDLGTVSGLAYIHVGVGRVDLSNYWIEYTQVEAKPYATSFIDGTRAAESLTIPTAGVLNPQEGTVELTYIPFLDSSKVALGGAMQDWWWILGAGSAINSDELRLAYAGGAWHIRVGGSSDTTYAASFAAGDKISLTLAWKQGVGARFFINGVKVATFTPSNFNVGTIVSIGYSYLWNGYRCNGLIDDLRISSRARTDEEIAAAYASNQPLPVDEYTTYKLPFDGNLKASKAGLRLSPVYNISSLGTATSSTISWNATLPTNTSLTIETNLSLDGGQTWQGWQVCTNGGAIPGITSETDLSNARLQLRETLATTDTTVTPQLHDITVNLNPPYKTAGYRESPAFGISGECRITWEATLNGQILAIQSNISRDGGTTWEGWQDCVNGGIIPGTDTGSLSNAKLKLKEILSTADVSKTPQLHKVIVSQPIYGYGLWSKNGYFTLNAPPVDGGIRVYDASGNLRTHIGQYASGKYGLKVTNGEIYSTRVRSGAETDVNYIQLEPPSSLGVYVNNQYQLYMSADQSSGGGYIYFGSNGVNKGMVGYNYYANGGYRMACVANDQLWLGSTNGIYCVGSLNMYSGSKNNVEPTSYGNVALTVRESPEQRYVDEGTGELINGECRIDIDPIFLECIEPDGEHSRWIIHITPYADATLYVSEIGDSYFVVKECGGSTTMGIKFAWSLSAVRRDYAHIRFLEVV